MKIKRSEQLTQLRRLTEKELSVKISESQKNFIVKQQEKLLGKLKNTAVLHGLRRDIARINTILDEKITARLLKDTNVS